MTEPIYLETLLAQAGREARDYVRRNLRLAACSTCDASLGEDCRSRSGRVVARHKGRRF